MKSLRKRFPVYSWLIGIYPKPYRDQYGDEILQLTADMVDAADGRLAKMIVWTRVAVDLPLNVAKQQLYYTGGTMQQTPHYIKRNGIIGSILLVPFFVALIANGVARIVYGQNLYNSWLWHMPVIAIWVIWLPEVALLLLLCSYMTFLIRKWDEKNSWIRRFMDLRHSWPVVVPGVLALGILYMMAFHDSAQCLRHAPSYLVTHSSQTWQCIAPSPQLLHFLLPIK